MIRLEQKRLNTRVYRKCFAICAGVLAKFGKRKKIDVHDYPAMVVACSSSWADYFWAEVECSGKVNRDSYRMVPDLEAALNSLGQIGTKRGDCNNYIGACAEPHAARAVLVQNGPMPVNQLVFSYAYRPRTKSVERYCRNCTTIFNVINP